MAIENSKYFRLEGPKNSSSSAKVAPGLFFSNPYCLSHSIYLIEQALRYPLKSSFHLTQKLTIFVNCLLLQTVPKWKYPSRLLALNVCNVNWNTALADTKQQKIAILEHVHQLSFSNCPVNHSTTKKFYIHNSGQAVSTFVLITEAPFFVENMEITVGPNEGRQLSVSFHPEKLERYHNELVLQQKNGETTKILLQGDTEDINVKLSTNILNLPDTFLTQTSQRQFKIINKSNVKVSYKLCMFATQSDDNLHKARKLNELSHMMDESSRKFRVSSLHTLRFGSITLFRKQNEILKQKIFSFTIMCSPFLH